MFGLPADIDLNFFIGKELQSIHIAFVSTIFHFNDRSPIHKESPIRIMTSDELRKVYENRTSIIAESPVGIMPPGETLGIYEDAKDMANKSVLFLGKVIKEAKGTTDGTLTLIFEDGSCLEFYDDSEQFEAYIITNGDKRIVV